MANIHDYDDIRPFLPEELPAVFDRLISDPEFKAAIETVYKVKGKGKLMCANVDFYSGFVYDMIGIPKEIYTPLFAMARSVGWCAHRNEELNFNGSRIIRPAYRCITDEYEYTPISKR